MQFLSELWMPILVSSVIVFITSAITHMVIPLHKKDFERLPDEDKIMGAVEGIPATTYMFPYCDHATMKDPEVVEKMNKGPIGILTVFPGPVNMGRNLGLTFLFYVVVGILIAFLGWNGLPAGTAHTFMDVFRFCGVAAFLAHGLGWMPMIIWYGGNKMFMPYLVDGIIYAAVTGGVFGWLWPKAAETVSMLN
ncbi:MAG: hypothetical protein KF784_09220 [Fimbriimonadaceae bacterium]|nr:hypothetical protein [Fimbriimonadaceae bacterium]